MSQENKVGMMPIITELDIVYRASHLMNLILACSGRIKEFLRTCHPLAFEIAFALIQKRSKFMVELDDLMAYVNDRLRNHYGCVEIDCDGTPMFMGVGAISSTMGPMAQMVDFESVQRCLEHSIIRSLPNEVLGGPISKRYGLCESLRGDPYPKRLDFKKRSSQHNRIARTRKNWAPR